MPWEGYNVVWLETHWPGKGSVCPQPREKMLWAVTTGFWSHVCSVEIVRTDRGLSCYNYRALLALLATLESASWGPPPHMIPLTAITPIQHPGPDYQHTDIQETTTGPRPPRQGWWAWWRCGAPPPQYPLITFPIFSSDIPYGKTSSDSSCRSNRQSQFSNSRSATPVDISHSSFKSNFWGLRGHIPQQSILKFDIPAPDIHHLYSSE